MKTTFGECQYVLCNILITVGQYDHQTVLHGVSLLTFAARFGLVPRSIFGAVQSVSPGSIRFHQVTRVTVVGHCVVESKLTSEIDPIGDWSRVSTTDH